MTPLTSLGPLFIGNDDDARRLIRTVRHQGDRTWHEEPEQGWSLVHAAKSPWHAQLLGYNSGPAPVDSSERLWAERSRRLYLNLVDSPMQLADLVVPILDKASDFIEKSLDRQQSVLVNCNMGLSRSPAVVLWWMHRKAPEQSYDDALKELLTDHPFTRTDTGIMDLVKEHWT